MGVDDKSASDGAEALQPAGERARVPQGSDKSTHIAETVRQTNFFREEDIKLHFDDKVNWGWGWGSRQMLFVNFVRREQEIGTGRTQKLNTDYHLH